MLLHSLSSPHNPHQTMATCIDFQEIKPLCMRPNKSRTQTHWPMATCIENKISNPSSYSHCCTDLHCGLLSWCCGWISAPAHGHLHRIINISNPSSQCHCRTELRSRSSSWWCSWKHGCSRWPIAAKTSTLSRAAEGWFNSACDASPTNRLFGYRLYLITGCTWLHAVFGYRLCLITGLVWVQDVFDHRLCLITGCIWSQAVFA